MTHNCTWTPIFAFNSCGKPATVVAEPYAACEAHAAGLRHLQATERWSPDTDKSTRSIHLDEVQR